MKYSELDKRMKRYEYVNRTYLTERLPVIIRLDGKSFHTFTRGFNKPFDDILQETMARTCEYLGANIMGCKLAYTQSDEISLLLINYESTDSDSWFKNNVCKMASVSASMATMAFNYYFQKIITEKFNCNDWPALPYWGEDISKDETGFFKMAVFDSRVFTLPKEEVCNYFIWRQQDASKNSVNMVAQSVFSHSELQNLNTNQLQEKLWQEKNINWNDYPVPNKRGICVTRQEYQKDDENKTIRHKWMSDYNIPIFTQDRDYIERFVFI